MLSRIPFTNWADSWVENFLAISRASFPRVAELMVYSGERIASSSDLPTASGKGASVPLTLDRANAWPDRRIAVSVEIDDDRDAWLTAHGWSVVPPETAAVRSALEGAR